MPQTMQVSWHQSRRYLVLLQKRLTELKKTLATRKPLVINVALKDPIPHPIPPREIPCMLLALKPRGRKQSDQILAAIFVATAEALTRTPTRRSKAP